MRKLIVSLLAAAVAPAMAADIGVSIEIAQPGVYGRVDIGRFPQPAVILPQPVIIEPPRVVVQPVQPVYMWVPPGHRKDWKKYCRHYNACGVPVYFVRHDWYEQHVKGRGRGGDDFPGKGKGHGKGKGKGYD
ncbi:MAG TPA: hypothetical protein VNK91_13585 [Burkholderiaceae bacterium]|jgi:hypothetical protein|nr:hypothetical protein [Burkholderiaceae bacterium]